MKKITALLLTLLLSLSLFACVAAEEDGSRKLLDIIESLEDLGAAADESADEPQGAHEDAI